MSKYHFCTQFVPQQLEIWVYYLINHIVTQVSFQYGMKKIIVLVIWANVICSCGRVTFNMSGANFGNAKTCQVVYFENRADIVYSRLSALMTDALKDKIQSSSSLRLVNSNADVMFEGEITGYNVLPQQITSGGTAAEDRLTITVKVKFTNELDTELSYDKSFSRFQVCTGGTFTSSEGKMVEDILEEIMEDIYNEAFATW